MDILQEQIALQNRRIQQAAVEKDTLLKQIDQAQARVDEIDRTITEARGVIAGIEFARSVKTESAKDNDQPDQ